MLAKCVLNFRRFSSTAGPILERVDQWTVNWQSVASQKLTRLLDQNSYDHASATNNFKHLERLVIDGFDKCSAAGAVQSDKIFICQHPSQNILKPDLSKQQTSDRIKSESVNLVNHDEHGQSDDPGDDDDEEEKEPGCEQPSLVAAGESRVERLGSPMINDGGRDYNVRACNQKTAGGGWTVKKLRFCWILINEAFL